jgi:CBS-domain-containing membrane protein
MFARMLRLRRTCAVSAVWKLVGPACRVKLGDDTMHALTVAEMMTTKVKTLRETESITAADWNIVIGGFRHIPVVDQDYRLIGMVSDTPRGTHATSTVKSIMTREVHAISSSTTALLAVEQMLMSKHNALPVVDDERRLLGIVTSTDFLELARRALSGLDIHQPHIRG